MTSEEQRIDEVINGKLRIWRFSEAEQSGSSNIADRFLWLAILRAESELASALFGGVPSGAAGSLDGTPSSSRFLKRSRGAHFAGFSIWKASRGNAWATLRLISDLYNELPRLTRTLPLVNLRAFLAAPKEVLVRHQTIFWCSTKLFSAAK